MSTRRWKGTAPAVKQESRATPASVEADDVFTLTVNGQSVSFTATAATVANVTAGLAAAWNASTVKEHAEITATDRTTYVELLADTAGVPFIVTSSTTNGGAVDDQTLTMSTPTPATGPNHWDDADNWTGGAVPVNGDDVYVDSGAIDILYGLDQSAVTLTSLSMTQGYTGKIGLPARNSGGYAEYREQYLKVSATTVIIGEGAGSGSARIKLDTGSNAATVNLRNSGTAASGDAHSVYWKGAHASNVVNVSKGSLGIAYFADETATLPTLRVGYLQNQGGDSNVTCGAGTTLTTVDVEGGTVAVHGATGTSINVSGGELTVKAGTHPLLEIDGGTVHYESTGTCTTGRVGSDGTLDFRRDLRTRTFTNLELHEGSSFYDPFQTLTVTNGIDFPRTGVQKLRAFQWGDHYTLQRSAI